MRTWLVLLVCLVTGAAAPIRPVLQVPDSAKKIAVYVAVPGTISVQYDGMTRFARNAEQVDVAEWEIPKRVVAVARDTLQARFDVVEVNLAGVPLDVEPRQLGPVACSQKEVLGDGDLLLIVYPRAGSETLQLTQRDPQSFRGFGVSKVKNPFVATPPLIHTFGTVALFDASSCSLIGSRNLQLPFEQRNAISPATKGSAAEMLMIGSRENSIPIVNVDIPDWPGGWGTFTPEDREVIRDKLLTLIDASMRFTLEQMLIPASNK